MTKGEIIEIINNTIVSNGKKGITAELLAYILTEMASATPEVSNSGSGGLIFYVGIPDETYSNFTLTDEELEHNINTFNTYVASPTPFIAFDISRFYAEMFMLEGVSYHVVAQAPMYIPEEIAAIDGMPAVIIDDYHGIMVYSDGTIEGNITEE